MPKYILDLECNGLLQQVTKIHCISIVALDSSYSKLYLNKDLPEFLKWVDNTEIELIGHNIYNFDLKVIEKLCGWKPHKDQKIHDTMILSQLLFSDLKNEEDKFDGHIFSKRDTGSHSLRAWGQRIHCYKGDYKGGWEEYNDDMGRYCIQDTYTTKSLFQFLQSKISEKLLNEHAINLEYSIAPILARQQAYGVLFDQDKAIELITNLTAKLVDLKWNLQEVFPPRYVNKGEFTPKRTNIKTGYMSGKIFTKIGLEEFNPSSRQQIVSRLITQFGWNPEEFTDKGNAKMDEDIIDNLPFKELTPLKEYLTIKKRISQIETGKQGWMKKVNDDSRIHGGIMQNGTVTGRMSHFSPNLGQIPANESIYGKECRELFVVPKGKIMIGVDADALEMRCLAGYLTPLDGGKFRDSLLHGKKELGTDPHTLNMRAMELVDRDCAKTIFYAWVYGAKNAKIGKTLMEYGADFREYVPEFDKSFEGLKEWCQDKGLEFSNSYMECLVAGKHCLKLFGDRIPELIELKKKIHERIEEVGYIKGLDGRKLFCRSEHGELNTVLQSAGAILMKKALFLADCSLQEQGLLQGIDYEFILNVHDEWQLECIDNPVNTAIIKETLEKSIEKAGEFFNFPCPLKGNSKIGYCWAETH